MKATAAVHEKTDSNERSRRRIRFFARRSDERAKYGEHDNFQPRLANVIEMLARAINDAGTATDVVKVAYALEGMKHD